MIVKNTHYWIILASQRKGVPQKLRSLNQSSLSLKTFTFGLSSVRMQNSKLSGTRGQMLELLFCSEV